MPYNWQKYFFIFSAGMFGGFVYKVLKRFISNRHKNKYLFLRREHSLCQPCFNSKTPFLCKNKTCAYEFLRLITRQIEQATESIDLCNPMLVLEEIINALMKAVSKNVAVRIIVDDALCHPPYYVRFLHLGVPVKPLGVDRLIAMHNKFIVIDKKILMKSSLNFSTGSFKGNYENFEIIYSPEQVKWFYNYFNALWDENSQIHNKETNVFKI